MEENKRENEVREFETINNAPSIDGSERKDKTLDGAILDNVVVKILEAFEDVLHEYDIYIPDDDRQGDEDEACLYGEAYYSLEDSITDIIKTLLE